MFQALSYLLLLILSSSLQAYVQAQGPPPGVALAVDSPTASEDICGPRIRKSWDMLTPVEKDIYLRAIGRAMDDGIYNKFIEIHTERLTSAEAHRTCMFIYWHRLFLLGFENMLRSYGGEFACITLPYWDYVTQNVGFLNGECSSMEACSPIMQEMGGSTSGTRRSVTINGTPVSNNICVNNPPLNHFCENANRQQCAQCVPRGTWSRAAFPPTASISSIMRQLFSATTIQEVANNIETGIHNTIHNSLGGVMGVLEAPTDPIFWSHHTTLDLLHSIYHRCLVGEGPPQPLQEKLLDPRQMVSCPRATPQASSRGNTRSGNLLRPESLITAQSGGSAAGTPALSIFDPTNQLAPFFAGLPTEYLALSDTRDLGVFSYNYQMDGILGELSTNCMNAGGLGSLLNGVGSLGGAGFFRKLAVNNTTPIQESSIDFPWIEARVISSDSPIKGLEWFKDVLNSTISSMSNQQEALDASFALKEVEKMTCLFYDECRGHLKDYSSIFRQQFRIKGSTPCTQILKDLKSEKDQIQVKEWRQIMEKHLQCTT